MQNNKTKPRNTTTARISNWVYKFFSDKATSEETTLIKKLEEAAEIFKLFDAEEVILEEFLEEHYKNDTTNTPRCVYETLQSLLHYWDKLNDRNFNEYSFMQFIDRWNIVAYYISSHVYTNTLPNGSLRDDELRQRAESLSALVFIFGKEVKNIIECINKIMRNIDPYENAYMSKKSKALIMSRIFENDELMSYLENDELMIRKETVLVELFEKFKGRLIEKGNSAFYTNIKSTGISNKIAYLIYNHYKTETLVELPYFVDEIFLSDLFKLLHSYYSKDYSSDLFYVKPISSAFKIAKVIKKLNKYDYEDSYLKSNLQHSNEYDKLDEVLQADIESLDKKRYTYHAEMRMRTPMHIVEQTTKTGIRYVQVPDIKAILLSDLINLCYPIYQHIINVEGEILHFRDQYRKTDIKSKNYKVKEANNDSISTQLVVSMDEKFYYACIILYVFGKASISINVKHSSIEKIYHCIHNMEGANTTKIQEKLSLYYDNDNNLNFSYKQGSFYLHDELKEAFIEIITNYVESEEFIKNKKFDLLNYGII